MTKRDWVEVGLKLMGTYFAVMVFVSVVTLIAVLDGGIDGATILQMIGYAIAAFVLVRCTGWCLDIVAPTASAAGDDTDPQKTH